MKSNFEKNVLKLVIKKINQGVIETNQKKKSNFPKELVVN